MFDMPESEVYDRRDEDMIRKRYNPRRDCEPTRAKTDCQDRRYTYLDAPRHDAKRTWIPPVITTLQRNLDGLPPGVITEWSDQYLLRSETDQDSGELRFLRSHWSDVEWSQLPRTSLAN